MRGGGCVKGRGGGDCMLRWRTLASEGWRVCVGGEGEVDCMLRWRTSASEGWRVCEGESGRLIVC